MEYTSEDEETEKRRISGVSDEFINPKRSRKVVNRENRERERKSYKRYSLFIKAHTIKPSLLSK